MSTLTLNGTRVTEASITIPMYGAWTADVSMAAATAVTGAVTLAIGSLSLKGKVFRSAVYAGGYRARIVGGAGGWRTTLTPKGYSQVAGVKLSTVLADAARETGESISIGSDRVIGTAYVRERAKGERVLKLLTNGIWYVDTAGVTQIRDRTSTPIVSAFTLVKRDGARGRFEIATEFYQDWTPGRTFTSPTVTDTQTISSVTFEAGNDGKLRLVVLSVATERERLLTEIRNMIRAEIAPLTYCGVWTYTIQRASASSIDAVPANPNGILPTLTNVPPLTSPIGETVTPTVGKTCVIAFLDADPTKPRWISAEGNATIVAVDASSLVRLGAGALPVARATDLAGIFPIVPSQVKVLA